MTFIEALKGRVTLAINKLLRIISNMMLFDTHTLCTHSDITRFSQLACFSRTSFAVHVISQLRQWGPWKALHGRHGSEIDSSDSEMSLRPSRHV